MKLNLSEALYCFGGLFHGVGHNLDAIEEELDEEKPDIENMKSYIELIIKDLTPVKIGDKYIPYGLIWDYVLAIKFVGETASYKNVDVIKNADKERQARHYTILEFAQEERKSDWDDMLSEEIEKLMGY